MKIKLCMVFIVFVFNNAYAQQSITANELNHQIIAFDTSLYSQTVACNKSEPPSIYDKNVEIYDGKNGLLSLTDLFSPKYFETCEKYKVEPAFESLAVYPLNNFGAILTGKQSHQKKQGAYFKTTSTNQYIHVYKYEQNEWKISRVFTYDSIPGSKSTNASRSAMGPRTRNSSVPWVRYLARPSSAKTGSEVQWNGKPG